MESEFYLTKAHVMIIHCLSREYRLSDGLNLIQIEKMPYLCISITITEVSIDSKVISEVLTS